MKKLLTILLALTLVTTLGLSAFATATPHDGTAAIEFKEGGLVIDPTNPPTGPLTNLGARSMKFKTYEITGNNATHDLLVAADGNTPLANQKVGVIVTDARGNATATWTSTVKATGFKVGAVAGVGGIDSLNAYTLTLIPSGGAIPGNDPKDAEPVVPGGPHVIEAGKPAIPIFKSNAAGSQGKWGLEFTPVLDTIGGTEVVGANEATITWGILLV